MKKKKEVVKKVTVKKPVVEIDEAKEKEKLEFSQN